MVLVGESKYYWNSLLVSNCFPLGCVICFSSVMLCRSSLCRYLREVVGVSVGLF